MNHKLLWGEPFIDELQDYSNAKITNGVDADLPGLLDTRVKEEKFVQRLSYEQATFLREGIAFMDLGTEAEESTRPILLYYSSTLLFSFFTRCVLHFDKPAFSHGLSLRVDSVLPIDKQNLSIRKSGEFQRIVDTLTVLSAPSAFSPLRTGKTGRYEVTGAKLSYFQRPIVPLDELIGLRKTAEEDEAHHVITRDLADYLLLYVASVFARYYPAMWNEITDGVNSSLIIYFRLAMDRIDIVLRKLLFAIEALAERESPLYPLLGLDAVLSEARGYDPRDLMRPL